MEKHRVVITGLGAVTPAGSDVETTWQTVLKGANCVHLVEAFPLDVLKRGAIFAGQCWDNQEDALYFSAKEQKHLDRFQQLAIGAAVEAVEDAGITPEGPRCGVAIGTSFGGLGSVEAAHKLLLAGRHVSPALLTMSCGNMATSAVACRFKATGPSLSSVSACAAGAAAIGEAFRTIQRGEAEIMLAGGAEAPITPLAVAAFEAMGALAKVSCRPFSRARDGFIIAEGAAVLVLEEMTHAQARGAKVYGELLGYGCSADAYHACAPHPDGAGAARAMTMAVHDAGLTLDQIDYIKAHASGTPAGDLAETRAIQTVFGQRATEIPISATKGTTGHMIGASGAVEALWPLLAMRDGVVPPTTNYRPDRECTLDYVPDTARHVQVRYALSNALGFGGVNCCLVFGSEKSNQSQ